MAEPYVTRLDQSLVTGLDRGYGARSISSVGLPSKLTCQRAPMPGLLEICGPPTA